MTNLINVFESFCLCLVGREMHKLVVIMLIVSAYRHFIMMGGGVIYGFVLFC